MGDDGALYVEEEVVPIYESIIPSADIIIPNQFEAELLSNSSITSLTDVVECFGTLHRRYRVPHIIISSLRLASHPNVILCCGSTATSELAPQSFIIEVPVID